MSGKLPFSFGKLTPKLFGGYDPATISFDNMSDNLPPGFSPKPDALEKFHKPERTFQRRLAKALKRNDTGFLSHLYLVVDNTSRIGSEVKYGEVDELKGQGMYPVWYVEEAWLANEYDRGKSGKSKTKKQQQRGIFQELPVDHSAGDRAALVAEIQSLRSQLEREREHNDLLTDQLDIKDEQIEAANKLAFESNTREKEYGGLLKLLTERIPTLPTQEPLAPQTPPDANPAQPKVVDAVIDAPQRKNASDGKPKTKNATKKKNAKPKTIKKKSNTKKSVKPAKEEGKPSFGPVRGFV